MEVSVLSAPEPIESLEAIRLGEHGLTLRKGGHFGLYLPEVAAHIRWDLETTLSQLALKAGLAAGAWHQGAKLEVFTSTRHRAPFLANSGGPVSEGIASDRDPALTHRQTPWERADSSRFSGR